QWNIACDDQITRLQQTYDFVISDIKTGRHLQCMHETRWRRTQQLVVDQRHMYLQTLGNTKQDVFNDGGTGIGIYPDAHARLRCRIRHACSLPVPQVTSRLRLWCRDAEVRVSLRGRNAPAWRALQISLLDQVRLQHIFDGVTLFADSGRQIVESDRAAIEFEEYGFKQLAIHQIKTDRVHIQHDESRISHFSGDAPRTFDLGIVAHATQQSVRDTRRTAT